MKMRTKTVTVDGEKFIIRKMKAREALDADAMLMADGKVAYDQLGPHQIRVVSLSVVDEKGAQVFTEETAGDIDYDIFEALHKECEAFNKPPGKSRQRRFSKGT